jgi:predicted permease
MNWRRFFQRDRADAEQRLELESYVDIATEEFIARGMEPHDAREAARRKLGNITQIREEVYRMNTLGYLEDFARHVRFTLRTLANNKSFAAIAILTLAIGIGANTAVFSVINSVLLRPLPYPDADRLVSIAHTAPKVEGLSSLGGELLSSRSMYFTYAEQNRSFEAVGIWSPTTVAVTGIGEPEQADTIVVSPGVLEALKVAPEFGHWFTASDQAADSPGTVLLSQGYWQQRFGGDRNVLGRTILLDGFPSRIIGVMPAGFRIADTPMQVIMPLRLDRAKVFLAGFGFNTIARLRRDVTLEQANADIGRLIPIWMHSWPSLIGGASPDLRAIEVYEGWKIGPKVRPLRETVVGNVGEVLWVIMGTLAAVMLIACANVANLLLVHVESRRQELAVRSALGAGWGRIVRELLLESALLSSMGAMLGLGFAYMGLQFLARSGLRNLPRLSEISLDAGALAFTAVVAALSALFFGLVPAWKYASRLSLRIESRTMSAGRERHRTRNALVVVQVGLALVLLICSGLMIRTFQNLRSVDPGFAGAEQIQTVRMAVPRLLMPEAEKVARMTTEIQEKLAALPGVESVGFASAVPMDNSSPDWDGIFAEGHTFAGSYPPMRTFRFAGPQFFSTMMTKVVAGREYTWDDLYNQRQYIIVSENLAREFWGSAGNAIGNRLRANPNAPWREVIGVAQDIRHAGMQQPAPATVYWPSFGPPIYPTAPTFIARAPVFVIRSSRANTQAFTDEIRRTIWSVNPNIPIANIETQSQIVTRSMARTSFTLVMLAIAGAMALVLGVIGIYGVLSYTVAQRRREAGIRIALGAAPAAVSAMFVRQGVKLSAIGIAAGLIAAAGLTRWMSALLFGVAAVDPVTYAATAALLLVAAAAACYNPARRAAAVDPAETMRGE